MRSALGSSQTYRAWRASRLRGVLRATAGRCRAAWRTSRLNPSQGQPDQLATGSRLLEGTRALADRERARFESGPSHIGPTPGLQPAGLVAFGLGAGIAGLALVGRVPAWLALAGLVVALAGLFGAAVAARPSTVAGSWVLTGPGRGSDPGQDQDRT